MNQTEPPNPEEQHQTTKALQPRRNLWIRDATEISTLPAEDEHPATLCDGLGDMYDDFLSS
jgi:hypothetical protein